MPDEELRVTIRLKDFASKGLTKVDKVVATVTGKMRKSFDRVKKAVFSLKGVLAALAVGAFVKSSVTAFTRQEKAIAGMEQAMKSMGRFTPQLAKRMQDMASAVQAVGVSGDEAVLEGQKFLVTYGKISNDLLPRATKVMADLAALTGRDMVSAANLLGKASEGMTGELRRYGISVSEASMKSKDFVSILGDIEKQVQGQQEALRATGYGGIEAFKNAFGDVQERIGEKFVKAFAPIIETLTTKLPDMGKYIDDLFSPEVVETFAVALGYVGTAFQEIAKSAILVMKAYHDIKVSVMEAKLAVEIMEMEHLRVNVSIRDAFAMGAGMAIQRVIDKSANLGALFRKMKEAKPFHETIKGAFALAKATAPMREDLQELVNLHMDINAIAKANEGGAMWASYQEEVHEVDVAIFKVIQRLDKIGANGPKIWASIVAAAKKARASIGGIEPELSKVVKSMAEVNSEFDRAADFSRDLYDSVTNLHWAMQAALSGQKDLNDETKEYGRILKQNVSNVLTNNILSALDDAIEGTFNWRVAVRGLAKDMAMMAARMALQAGMKAAFGFAQGGIAVGGTQKIPSAAQGRVAVGPQIVQVGDNREKAEAILPLKRGPDGNLGVRGGAGGGGTQIIINAVDARGVIGALMEGGALRTAWNQMLMESGAEGLGLA